MVVKVAPHEINCECARTTTRPDSWTLQSAVVNSSKSGSAHAQKQRPLRSSGHRLVSRDCQILPMILPTYISKQRNINKYVYKTRDSRHARLGRSVRSYLCCSNQPRLASMSVAQSSCIDHATFRSSDTAEASASSDKTPCRTSGTSCESTWRHRDSRGSCAK